MKKPKKPYGRTRPQRVTPRHLRVWAWGIRDGWNQPRDLSSTKHIDHDPQGDLQESLDAGANLGQFLRAPATHQMEA